jgi:hypothetical protein
VRDKEDLLGVEWLCYKCYAPFQWVMPLGSIFHTKVGESGQSHYCANMISSKIG